MALVVLPEGQQRSGKQGGVVWSHNKGGPYIRNRGIPTNPKTPAQEDARAALMYLTEMWQTALNNTQRNAWETFGNAIAWKNRLGQDIKLPGQAHFFRGNSILRLRGGAVKQDAPTVLLMPPTDNTMAATASAATQLVSVYFNIDFSWRSENGALLQIQQARPLGPSCKSPRGGFQFADVFWGNAGAPPASPKTFASIYTLSVGQACWLQLRIVRADSRASETKQVRFLVAA
jgi:hypothetical protein